MTDWWKDIRRILWGIAFILGLLFIVFVVNQFTLLYQFLSIIHPILAMTVLALIGGGILYVLYRLVNQLLRSPKVIELDENYTEEEYANYLDLVLALLQKNPHVTLLEEDTALSKEEQVQTYFTQLDDLSLPLIKQNANAIFLSTAISQNGSLDSLVVLFSLLRMVWQLAGIYQTRPSLISLAKLYIQVASVVLMARTIEETDLIEYQMEPLITTIVGESIASAIPGMVPITNLVVSSLMEGAINAFLTLRVGIITQEFLGRTQAANKQTLRRSASMQSVKFMGSIIKDNSKVVVKTVGNAARKAGVGTAKRWFNFSDNKQN